MSTTSTTTSTPIGTPAPRLSALLRSEVLRARSRRSLLWLPVLALLAVIGVAAILWFDTARVSQAQLDAAIQQSLAEQQMYYEECMTDPDIPEQDRSTACWLPSEEEVAADAVYYLDRQPFDQDRLLGLLSMAGGLGLLVCLLLAATTGGADWGARTMGLLLSWEPRRNRVFLVRLVVIVVIAVTVEALLVLAALGLGAAIDGAHGVGTDPALAANDWSISANFAEAQEIALRWLPLAGLAAAGSFAVAMLTRSTGWAIGASIGFVAIVESVLGGVWPWISQWLVQTNIIAWLSDGMEKMVDPAAAERGGFYQDGAAGAGFVFISGGRALTTLAAIALLAALVGWIAFLRRDVE